jgi:cystathionine beta-lyase
MNFDQLIDRRQYPTLKWDRAYLSEYFGNAEAIPMSVADMDLKAPPSVIAQLHERVAHGIYGYETRPEDYHDELRAWYQRRHRWTIDPQYIEPCASIMNAISILIEQHTEAGNGVILQPPVFFEFKLAIRNNGRRVVKNPLNLVDGRYQIDFDDLEAKASDPDNTLLILCNPHNPVGRVWTEDELKRIAEICERHGVFVIADEVHGDFALPPHTYTPYLSVAEPITHECAACISPAKTFNISGMVDAVTVIPDETNRRAFHEFVERYQMHRINVFASVATETAYREGAEWLDDLLVYIQGNVDWASAYLAANIPPVSLVEPEGTFLLWLDFRELGMDVKALARFLAVDAGVALSPGYWFGREGAGFARMTIGCPRATVRRAFDHMARAIAGRG